MSHSGNIFGLVFFTIFAFAELFRNRAPHLIHLIVVLFCTIGYVVETILSQWLQTHQGFGHRILWVAGLIFFCWRLVVAIRKLRQPKEPTSPPAPYDEPWVP